MDTAAPWTQDILVGYGDLKPLGPVGDVGLLAPWVAKVCSNTADVWWMLMLSATWRIFKTHNNEKQIDTYSIYAETHAHTHTYEYTYHYMYIYIFIFTHQYIYIYNTGRGDRPNSGKNVGYQRSTFLNIV